MSLMRPLLLPAVILSLMLCWPVVAAEVSSSQTVQKQLDSLADRKLPEAEELALRQQLQNTLDMLQRKESLGAELQEVRKQLDAAPQQTNIALQQFAQLKKTTEVDVQKHSAGQSIEQLQAIITASETQLSQWQAQLQSASQMTSQAQGRPERAQTEIAANQARTQVLDAILRSGKQNNRPLSQEDRDQLQAEKDMLKAQDALTLLLLEGNNLLLGLGNARSDLLNLQITRKEAEILALQMLINDKRLQETEKVLSKLLGDDASISSPLVQEQLNINKRLSSRLLKYTQRLNELTRENLQARQQLDSLRQQATDLESVISELHGSQLLSRVLLQQRIRLPDINVASTLPDEIADARLIQFELDERRLELRDPAAQLAKLLDGQPDPGEEVRQQLLALMQQRASLIERLDEILNPLLSQAITLQSQQDKLQKISSNLSSQIEDQLFWLPSNAAINLKWLQRLPENLQNQITEIPWGASVRTVIQELSQRLWLFVPTLLVIGLLIWRRKWMKDKLASYNREIGHYKRDSQLHTPMALLFCVLLGLPLTLLLLLAGNGLQQGSDSSQLIIGHSLVGLAWVWLLFYAVFRILKPGNVGERHFHWDSAITRPMSGHVRNLGLLIVPLIFLGVMAHQQPELLRQDYLGRLIVVVNLLMMTWVLGGMFKTLQNTSNGLSGLYKLVSLLIVMLPLVLAGIVIAGYYYTALMLSSKLLETIYCLLVFVVADATSIRGLNVAARRLAYARMLEKRNAASRETADGVEIIEEPVLDIASINEQSLRLIRLALLGVLGAALYMVWAELLSAFTYLDSIVLYEYSSGVGATAFMVPLSLSDLILALLLVTVTVMLARNLPGLLEVLVLSRLKLAQGATYATTTLISYVIFGAGVIITLGILGLSWDKLQFLVAAFSLGLAFGMQEIFANFISGLIILFERPVRIGDTVTLGNLSGTVSRIQIRATTITDFDRKEIIVPNKTFITDQVINWSLTDTVSRVVQTIGLSYETDLTLARQLIMQVLTNNPKVLHDPEPQIFFVNIGASTFNYEVRFHVKELADRLPVTNEILTEIVAQFRENNIEMAFNQMDIYVKNMQGQEAKLESRQSNPPSPINNPSSTNGDAQ